MNMCRQQSLRWSEGWKVGQHAGWDPTMVNNIEPTYTYVHMHTFSCHCRSDFVISTCIKDLLAPLPITFLCFFGGNILYVCSPTGQEALNEYLKTKAVTIEY